MGFKENRLAMGKSVSAFAKELSCSAYTVRKIEAGKADAKTYFKIISSWPVEEQLIAFEAILKAPHFDLYSDPDRAKFCEKFLKRLRLEASLEKTGEVSN